MTMFDPEMFGDSEPEDSWCVTDRVGVLINNLRRRIAALDGWPLDLSDDLNDIAGRMFAFLQANAELSPAQELRADLLFHDLQTVRGRLDEL